MTRRNTDVMYAAKVFHQVIAWEITDIFIRERNRTNANFAHLASPVKEIMLCMKKDILVTNETNQRNDEFSTAHHFYKQQTILLFEYFILNSLKSLLQFTIFCISGTDTYQIMSSFQWCLAWCVDLLKYRFFKKSFF